MVARWDYITDVTDPDKETAAVSCQSVIYLRVNFALAKKEKDEEQQQRKISLPLKQVVPTSQLIDYLSHQVSQR